MNVRFRPEVSRADSERLLAEQGLRIVRQMNFAPNLFLVEAALSVGDAINQIAIDLTESDLIEYAEPQLAESPELDQIVPTDYLWPGTWDRQLVDVSEAWQLLADNVSVDQAFGRPDVIIAVVDQGIKSQGGIPENPDFQGDGVQFRRQDIPAV